MAADQNLESSRTRLLEQLARWMAQGGTPTFRSELEAWHDALCLFMHTFPHKQSLATESSDDFQTLRSEAELGLYLLEELAGQEALLDWGMMMSRRLESDVTIGILKTLNANFATRRDLTEVPDAYWSGVNFVPDLEATLSSNLRDYWAAQAKALADAMRKADAEAPDFPGQSLFIKRAHERTQALIRLYLRFESLTGDDAILLSWKERGDYYGRICEGLKRYEQCLKSGDSAKAAAYAQDLRKIWQENQLRRESSPKQKT